MCKLKMSMCRRNDRIALHYKGLFYRLVFLGLVDVVPLWRRKQSNYCCRFTLIHMRNLEVLEEITENKTVAFEQFFV